MYYQPFRKMVERGRNREVQATCRENAGVVRRCDVMLLNSRDMDGFVEWFQHCFPKPPIALLKKVVLQNTC
jgi:hypothetical protein